MIIQLFDVYNIRNCKNYYQKKPVLVVSEIKMQLLQPTKKLSIFCSSHRQTQYLLQL